MTDPSARADEQISLRTKAYTTAQFSIASVVAMWLLWLRSQHSLAVQIVTTLWLILSIGTLGMVLDNAPRARTYELLRVLASLLAVGCVFYWPESLRN